MHILNLAIAILFNNNYYGSFKSHCNIATGPNPIIIALTVTISVPYIHFTNTFIIVVLSKNNYFNKLIGGFFRINFIL